MKLLLRALALGLAVLSASACSDDAKKGTGASGARDGGADAALPPPELHEGTCTIESGAEAPDSLPKIDCKADFEALASEPIDADLPGARSVKVVFDTTDSQLYFQNSVKYAIHYEFASANLSGGDHPVVPALASFNATEYYSPDRRFILGAVTHYEGPGVWAFEIAPYDTASAAMIERIFGAVKEKSYFGPALAFHPTSETVTETAEELSSSVPIKTTDDLYAQIDYQPLTLATAIGRLHFMKAADLAAEYVPFRDILVLDAVPNDISVVSGLITAEFQTPLSHINVLSQNRHTPNMGLRNALTNPELVALEGKWVELTVGASDWKIREATVEEADAYWEAHKPAARTLPPLDLTVTGLVDIEDVTPEVSGTTLRASILKAVAAFGGKAAQYSILAKTPDVPVRKAFAVPVFYYDQFMKQNGFFDRIDALLSDATFQADPAERDRKLLELRNDMQTAPVDAELSSLLQAKLAADYPGLTMRFRTSTNSEDLDGFPCAGCYESHTGDPADWNDVLDAIRETWASIWLFRTFEERTYYGVDHKSVGMALLVHHNFPAEEANGVAVTANPFDASGLDPALYVNVQWGGDAEVVHPPPDVSSDQFLYYFGSVGQPITYISHSNLISSGTVLTTRQVHELGVALTAIHERFSLAYGPGAGNFGFYAMDVEFKFDDEDTPGEVKLVVKQARPYPGRGNTETDGE